MSRCCSPFSEAATDQFGAGVARRDVASYRRRGPDAPTRLLRDSVLAADTGRLSVLDIGGGIGALSLELIAAGVQHATLVDASASYLSAAREEATRTDRTRQLDIVAGDFVELGGKLPPAEIVAMNRVVCCYPDWYIRAVGECGNTIRAITGKTFRTFVHDERAMHALIEARGFRRQSRRDTFVWQIEVWTR